MKKTILAFLGAALLAGTAWAQGAPAGDKPAAAGMDMTKVGPASRKPKDEAAVKKEIGAFFKDMDELEKKNDMAGMLGKIDFPVYMMTDDSKGVPKTEEWSKEQYETMMKGMMENMPKDIKMTHKPNVAVLSDSLVNVTDDYTMTMGKQKMSGRSMGVLVKRDGQWKFKVMGEAGWGDIPSPPAAAKK